MIYVFDDFEQLQTCCGCPVTPDGMRTLSVINDLTSNFGMNGGNLNDGVVEIVTSVPNWTPGIPAPAPNPPGTNGPSLGNFANGCSPASARTIPIIAPVPSARSRGCAHGSRTTNC